MSVMYERMSNAQVRLNLFMKSFGENDILREHLWSCVRPDLYIKEKARAFVVAAK
jgi:hypothetical protein